MKHSSTAQTMRHLRVEVMELCEGAGLYQIDLLNGSKERVSEAEYWARRRGQLKLDRENAGLAAAGQPPRQKKFETVKDTLRKQISSVLYRTTSFEDFSDKLMRQYGIAVKESRGQLSYLPAGRTKFIRAKHLGDKFDKAAVLATLQANAERKPKAQFKQDTIGKLIDIQAKLAAGKGTGYERWAKKYNLKAMAQTLILLQEKDLLNEDALNQRIAELENKYHAYYATKMALWCYLLPNWNINNLKVNPNLTGTELQRAQAILAAAKDIYVRGTAWSKVYSPRVTATADRDTAYAVTVNGQQYKQQVFTVHSDTWVCNYAIRVSFSDPGSVPDGTRIVDMDNKDIATITTSGTGDGYGGKFKVLYPASAVAGKTGSVQLSFTTNVYKYAVFYATCAEVSKYGQLQNYMCDTDPTTTMRLSTYSNYSDGEKTEEPDTGLKIIKLEKGTDTPLSGAVFEVVDPDGATVGTFATGS